jgi:hypothetical protein
MPPDYEVIRAYSAGAVIEFLAVLHKIIAKIPRCCEFGCDNNEKSTNINFFSFSNKNKSPKIYRQCILILVDK